MTDPSQTLPRRYRDPHPIGSGGMGDIYRATDTELGRDVAVKVLAARFAEDGALRSRFEREALAAARLSSDPHIVTIFDVDEHGGRPLIVMEYLPGGSLAQRLEQGGIPAAEALGYIEDAAAGLDAAHRAGIVHRDVKPGNLLLDARGRVQIADFGIASAAGTGSLTQTGTIMGTAGYLSPEQARGERATPASDRYSLAVVAWELLTGHRPFEAESATAEAAAHVHAPVPSVHAANPAVPAALDRVFQRALAKDPAARYPSAEELAGELRRALQDDAGQTQPLLPTRAVAAPRRSLALPAAILAALLVAGGILAAVLLTRGNPDSPTTARQVTVVKTVTGAGTTIEQTVTASPPAPASTEPTTTAPAAPSGDGSSLNDEGYAKMKAGDYKGALPLLEQAVSDLQGTGSTTEAYASYNLAYTRYALGQCTDVLSLLARAASLEGDVAPIQQLRAQAQKSC